MIESEHTGEMIIEKPSYTFSTQEQLRILSNKVALLEKDYQELFKHVVESRNREIQTLQIIEKLLGGQQS
jgi:hypothetical protein